MNQNSYEFRDMYEIHQNTLNQLTLKLDPQHLMRGEKIDYSSLTHYMFGAMESSFKKGKIEIIIVHVNYTNLPDGTCKNCFGNIRHEPKEQCPASDQDLICKMCWTEAFCYWIYLNLILTPLFVII